MVEEQERARVLGRRMGDENHGELKSKMSPKTAPAVDRWVEDQLFEEDIRAVLMMMRPNRRERLQGWSEYRTGGKDFRATISWNGESVSPIDGPDAPPHADLFSVPNLVDVLEALLIGSIRSDSDLSAEEECEAYRAILRVLDRRVGQFQECYA